MDLAPDFNELCALLRAHRVDFVIVGAPRFTGDLDILIRPTTDNPVRLIAAIVAFGFPQPPLSSAQVIEPARMIEMGVAPVQIRVMSHVDGVSWDGVWASRESGPLASETVHSSAATPSFTISGRRAGRRISPTSKRCGKGTN